MPPRVKSPYNAGRPAVVEPIVQPIYDKVQFTAAGSSKLTWFAQAIGSAGVNELTTNMDTPNQFPNPKIAVILGMRLHATQLVGDGVITVAAQYTDLLKLFYSYWINLFIGAKSYLKIPAFYLSSGLGVQGSFGAAVTDQAAMNLGWPTFHSYWKCDRHPITIPPQQNFRVEANQGADFPSDLSAARNVWCILETDFGREVQ
jgi:hypothetical protein